MLRDRLVMGAALLVACSAAGAFGQIRNNRTTSAGAAAATDIRTQGLEQTGQLSSAAAIQRDESAFVGGTAGNFLSRAAASAIGTAVGANALLGGVNSQLGYGGAGYGGIGYGGIGGLGRMGRMGYGNRNMYNQGNLGNQTTQARVRTALQLGFQAPQPTATQVSARFARRLPRIPGLESTSGVAVRMDGRTAVLQGVVASQNQRDLIGRLALLEPGISDVRNELVVAPRSAPGVTPPEVIPAPSP